MNSLKAELTPDYEKRLADFRQVINDKTGKCWWQILCRWCQVTIEEYEREKFPKTVPTEVLVKLAVHSLVCPELWKCTKGTE